MAKLKTILRLLKNPRKMIKPLGHRGLFNWLPDMPYLKLVYRAEMQKKLNLNEPKTFNEKLQWLKLYDRDPIYTKYVDKYEVRSYIAETIGEEYLIPLIGEVYDNVDEIDWDMLPSAFVIKCTHGSSTNIVCRDKSKLNINETKKRLREWLNKNWYSFGREWPYKNIKPRIICEKYMVDESGIELKDYKFFCFNGKVKFFKVDFNRFSDHRANYYDLNKKLLYFGEVKCPPDYQRKLELPSNIYDMVILAEQLSRGKPFLRVDFYNISGRIYFGEITFFPASGFGKLEPDEWDYKLGSWLELPDK